MLRKRAVFAPHIVKGTMLDLGLQVSHIVSSRW